MNQEYIEFKRKRELGEIISVTFAFVRDNYKSLLSILFKISWPILILALAASIFYMYTTFGLGFGQGSFGILSSAGMMSGIFVLALFAMLICTVLLYAVLYSGTLQYIKSYVKHQGQVEELEVRQGVKNSVGGMIGLLFLVGIMIVIGLFICFFPGVYLAVPLSLTFAIYTFERKDIGEAISHSFTLIKDHWWVTFFTIIIISILVAIINYIFQIPALIYFFAKTFISIQDINTADPTSMVDWIDLILNSIATLAQYIFSIVSVVCITFIYFNLNEHRHDTGTFEQIENLGKRTSDS
ncbi:hypothetical protein GCM10009117_14070 [Gangjinia marincola]|uniref:Glycerophosphoryl diester phosphodiesterase membrane domain-containing protein n=1 Tax=Gangjinia marincola TaxID=578463 RepID=A0ABN1MGI4_9FLAO